MLNKKGKKFNCENVSRGDVFFVQLEDIIHCEGSEQGGIRPAICIQNDVGNRYSPTTIVVLLTSKNNKRPLPTHVDINIDKEVDCWLEDASYVLCEQIRTISKTRIRYRKGRISENTMKKIDRALLVSLGLNQ